MVNTSPSTMISLLVFIPIIGNVLTLTQPVETRGVGCRVPMESPSYTGHLDQAESGDTCLPWADFPQYTDRNFPDRDKAAAGSNCREVSSEVSKSIKGPWCHTATGRSACDVPICSELRECLIFRNGKQYSGTESRSRNGTRCLPWADRSMGHNHCRNPAPSSHPAPWCHVDGGEEDCDVPLCPGLKALEEIQPKDCDSQQSERYTPPCKDFHLIITHASNSPVFVSPKSLVEGATYFSFLLMASDMVHLSLYTTFEPARHVIYFSLSFSHGSVSSAKLTDFKPETFSSIGSSSAYSYVWVDWTEGFVKLGTGPDVGDGAVLWRSPKGLRCFSYPYDCQVKQVAVENEHGVAYWIFNAAVAKWATWGPWSKSSGGLRERRRNCNGNTTRLNFCTGINAQTESGEASSASPPTKSLPVFPRPRTYPGFPPTRPSEIREVREVSTDTTEWTKTIVLCMTIFGVLIIAMLVVCFIFKRRSSRERLYAQAVERICRGQSLPVGSFGWPRRTPEGWRNSMYLFQAPPCGMVSDVSHDLSEHMYDSVHAVDRISPLPSLAVPGRTPRMSISSSRSVPRSSISSIRSNLVPVTVTEME